MIIATKKFLNKVFIVKTIFFKIQLKKLKTKKEKIIKQYIKGEISPKELNIYLQKINEKYFQLQRKIKE